RLCAADGRKSELFEWLTAFQAFQLRQPCHMSMSTLRIENLSAAYDRRVALQDVSFAATAGQVVGVIGPNGAGKSTLLRAISGTLAPTGGSIRFGDVDLLRLAADERARCIAVGRQLART